jgi:hypothetical protein
MWQVVADGEDINAATHALKLVNTDTGTQKVIIRVLV